MNTGLKKQRTSLIQLQAVLLVFVIFFIWLSVHNVSTFPYDSSGYWTLTDGVLTEEGFNLYNFDQLFRGYFFYFLITFLKRFGLTIFASELMGFWVFTALSAAIGLAVVFPYLFEFKVDTYTAVLRLTGCTALILYFWGYFILYPLSDLPAALMMCAGAALLKFVFTDSTEKAKWKLYCAAFAAGVCLYGAYNTRTAYLYVGLFIIAGLFVPCHRQKLIIQSVIRGGGGAICNHCGLRGDCHPSDFDQRAFYGTVYAQDNSWAVIQELAARDPNIRPIRLSRNFGSHAAILCGLSHSTGDCAVVKAADLQEPNELLLEMYRAWENGSNVVLAIRKEREDKSLFSDLYYWLMRKFAFPQMPPHGFDVFLADRKVIRVLEALDEKNSALTGQLLWSGFRTSHVYYTRKQREIGTSRWTLKKKIRLVSDTLFSFSTLPITVVTGTGLLSCTGSALWAVITLIGKFGGGIPVQGYTTLFIFQLFSFGVIMLTLGLLGNYLWRTFDASRKRPIYIIEEDGVDCWQLEEQDAR